jgi:hypothetical protein
VRKRNTHRGRFLGRRIRLTDSGCRLVPEVVRETGIVRMAERFGVVDSTGVGLVDRFDGIRVGLPARGAMTLNPDVLLDAALSRLTRGFTGQECATYDIEPCPTLEEMTAG